MNSTSGTILYEHESLSALLSEATETSLILDDGQPTSDPEDLHDHREVIPGCESPWTRTSKKPAKSISRPKRRSSFDERRLPPSLPAAFNQTHTPAPSTSQTRSRSGSLRHSASTSYLPSPQLQILTHSGDNHAKESRNGTGGKGKGKETVLVKWLGDEGPSEDSEVESEDFESDDGSFKMNAPSMLSSTPSRRSSTVEHSGSAKKKQFGIRLHDETERETNMFARDAHIRGFCSVGEKGAGFVVYDIEVVTKENTRIRTLKRYSAFVQLRNDLISTFPNLKRAMPPLPNKSSFAKFRPSFLERRQRQLGYWLQTVLLHPETGGCGIVREWILR